MRKILGFKVLIKVLTDSNTYQKYFVFNRDKALTTLLIYVSVIPQALHINRIVSKNILSGDWYLARQLLRVSRDRIVEFDLISFVSFVDPANSKPIFGNLGYSNGLQILTPDMFLFKFLPENFIFLFHFLFVTSISILYILKLAETFRLGNLQTVLFAITWLNSGPLVARVSEGHIQLLGYYLVPAFFYHLYLIKTSNSIYNYVSLGFFLGFIELLGSTHVYFQMCLILLLVTVFNPKKIFKFLITLLISIFSSAIQILPIIFYPIYNESSRSVYEGYGYHFFEKYFDLSIQSNSFEFLREIIGIPLHLFIALLDSDTAIQSGGWEWTLYIGLVPGILILFSIWKFTNDIKKLVYENLYLIPVFLLSLSLVYRFLYLFLSEIANFVAVDRVPYRMMIYIFCLLWFYTCFKLPILLSRFYGNRNVIVLFLILIYCNLIISVNHWFTRHRLESQVDIDYLLEIQINPNYNSFVFSCLVLTLLSWIVFILFIFKLKPKTRIII